MLAAKTCHLIGGAFANVLQFVLGLAALVGLLVKRQGERPRRPFIVWWYDVSKQGYAALLVHAWNIFMSMALAVRTRGDAAGLGVAAPRDECALYFVQFALDVLLGVALVWVLIRTQERLARRYNWPSLAISGDYGNPPRFQWFVAQMGVYMLSVVAVKTVITLVVLAGDAVLSDVSAVLFAPVREFPEAELTIVMIICPWILNALQFWMMDNM
ncbi:vacuolar membrane protein-domain-containing protein [Tribonema minus]|uniref:Vacuolar membrane protein-domain-containing protein n=1 Tax=Tribonema minus TaxID=303371 RepID=A0A836CED2_9STRA|nr:vacuolar membrane protein-domain-containing protein [Tribonema minus]